MFASTAAATAGTATAGTAGAGAVGTVGTSGATTAVTATATAETPALHAPPNLLRLEPKAPRQMPIQHLRRHHLLYPRRKPTLPCHAVCSRNTPACPFRVGEPQVPPPAACSVSELGPPRAGCRDWYLKQPVVTGRDAADGKDCRLGKGRQVVAESKNGCVFEASYPYEKSSSRASAPAAVPPTVLAAASIHALTPRFIRHAWPPLHSARRPASHGCGCGTSQAYEASLRQSPRRQWERDVTQKTRKEREHNRRSTLRRSTAGIAAERLPCRSMLRGQVRCCAAPPCDLIACLLRAAEPLVPPPVACSAA